MQSCFDAAKSLICTSCVFRPLGDLFPTSLFSSSLQYRLYMSNVEPNRKLFDIVSLELDSSYVD